MTPDSPNNNMLPSAEESPEIVSVPAESGRERLWGAGTGLLVWLASIALLLALQIVGLGIYLAVRVKQTGQIPKSFELDWLMALLTLITTLPAHLLTILVCYLVVTRNRKRPFLRTIGWEWHPQFKWVHAVALAFLMMGIAFGLEKMLPHRETDLEKLLKLGASIRYLVAILAVFTAPLVEELVYRGVLYTGIERSWNKVGSVISVTFLFALVHVPQYWGSYAAIAAILVLSLVLTLVRAFTGRLLPCIATHLVYNGIQSIALVIGGKSLVDAPPAKTALILLGTLLQ